MIRNQGNGQFLVQCDDTKCNEQFVSSASDKNRCGLEARTFGWKDLSDGFHICPKCDRTWSAVVDAVRTNYP